MIGKVIKKLGVLVACLSLISLVSINAHAEDSKAEWNTYYTGPGAAYPTDIVSYKYNNPFTNYVQAKSVTGSGAKVVVSGVNVNMYDIPQGRYVSYTFTASNMTRHAFRPVSKSGTVTKGTYMCASSGNSTYYSSGELWY